MRKSLLILALGLFTLTASASPDRCRTRLLGHGDVDSAAFSLNADEVFGQRDFGRDYLAEAIFAVRALLEDVKCSRNDINFGQGPLGRSHSKCRLIVNHAPQSAACYIESNLGYFFVTQDYLNNINIVYNRWD